MFKELEEIREELLIGVEKRDLLYIKMQINKIDTLICGLVTNGETVKLRETCPSCGSTDIDHDYVRLDLCLNCGEVS